jgi:hypothetical protein
MGVAGPKPPSNLAWKATVPLEPPGTSPSGRAERDRVSDHERVGRVDPGRGIAHGVGEDVSGRRGGAIDQLGECHQHAHVLDLEHVDDRIASGAVELAHRNDRHRVGGAAHSRGARNVYDGEERHRGTG